MNVIEATGLGKCYGKSWALKNCTLQIPEGRLAALVGPNGAGKSTLMNMAVGITVPSTGTVTVLGGRPAGSPPALNGVAFVAQDAPVYKNLPVRDMIRLTRNLNRRFDSGYATARLNELGIPLRRKAGKLSGGGLQAAGETDDLIAAANSAARHQLNRQFNSEDWTGERGHAHHAAGPPQAGFQVPGNPLLVIRVPRRGGGKPTRWVVIPRLYSRRR